VFASYHDIATYDPDLHSAMAAEAQRQEEHVELIASENYASPRVMEAQGSVLTNKYAEGYPGRRYYGGCAHVDKVEELAKERACRLFDACYANVQPHSGSQANAAVLMALCKPGDTVLGMRLAHGGHLTHGANVSFSGRIYNAVQYGLSPDTGEIDYEEVETLAHQHQPRVIIAGFSAYSRKVDWARFRQIADEVGARLLVDMAHVAGLIAAGVYPSPLPFAHVCTTTTHKTLAGPRGGLILSGENDPALHKSLDFAVFPESQGGPLCHVIAAKAVCFLEAMEDSYRAYQEQVLNNARALADTLAQRGLTIVSGGTDNHLLLVDLTGKEFSGADAEQALGKANITVNKNTVPNDPRSPFVTSGLRLGSPAITRRGFTEKDCVALGGWIADILDSIGTDQHGQVVTDTQDKVVHLCRQLPVYKPASARSQDPSGDSA